MKFINVVPYVTLGVGGAYLLVTNPRSWVLVPVALVLAATVVVDVMKAWARAES